MLSFNSNPGAATGHSSNVGWKVLDGSVASSVVSTDTAKACIPIPTLAAMVDPIHVSLVLNAADVADELLRAALVSILRRPHKHWAQLVAFETTMLRRI